MNRTSNGVVVVALFALGCAKTGDGPSGCDDPNPDLRIVACTTLLASTSLSDSARAHLLHSRGVAYRMKDDYDHAIADYDESIKLWPDAGPYNSRGFAWQLKGDFDRAMIDFNEATRIKPSLANALKNRGRTEFFLGRYGDAVKDLEAGLQSDSTNAYSVIWLHLATMRLGKDNPALASQLARADSVKWPAVVGQFYLGKRTAEQLLAAGAADSTGGVNQRCAAAFYIGESLLWQGHVPEAKQRFDETVSACQKKMSEYQGAVAELGRLPAKGH